MRSDGYHVAEVRCKVCSESQLRSLQNYRPTFFEGTDNVRLSTILDHAKPSIHCYIKIKAPSLLDKAFAHEKLDPATKERPVAFLLQNGCPCSSAMWSTACRLEVAIETIIPVFSLLTLINNTYNIHTSKFKMDQTSSSTTGWRKQWWHCTTKGIRTKDWISDSLLEC